MAKHPWPDEPAAAALRGGMAPPAFVEVSPECSRDIVLGQVVGALNGLIASNQEDHARIFARLDEGDKYLFIFKASRCSFEWLDRQGAIKYTMLLIAFFILDWFSRSLYWGIFPKP